MSIKLDDNHHFLGRNHTQSVEWRELSCNEFDSQLRFNFDIVATRHRAIFHDFERSLAFHMTKCCSLMTGKQ
jgi:hypothetical protein